MPKPDPLFESFCFAQAAFESSRHVYRREHAAGQVRRFFNISFTAFELRRYMMDFYFSKGSFTISDLVKVSDFSRPTVSSTVHEALKLKYIEKIKYEKIRFRSLGCYPLSSPIFSNAVSVKEIIEELILTKNSERQGRMIDKESSNSMELKKLEGYF